MPVLPRSMSNTHKYVHFTLKVTKENRPLSFRTASIGEPILYFSLLWAYRNNRLQNAFCMGIRGKLCSDKNRLRGLTLQHALTSLLILGVFCENLGKKTTYERRGQRARRAWDKV